jgi:hypothetical protein
MERRICHGSASIIAAILPGTGCHQTMKYFEDLERPVLGFRYFSKRSSKCPHSVPIWQMANSASQIFDNRDSDCFHAANCRS